MSDAAAGGAGAAHAAQLTGTATIALQQTSEPGASSAPPAVTLRLRAPRRVRFDESAVDNEHLGRKKSKSCCVYHRRRAFDESSDESDFECGDCAPEGGSAGGSGPAPSAPAQ